MLPLPLFTFRNFFAANLVTAFVYGVLTLGTNSSIADAASLAVASCGPGPSQLGALRRSRVLVRPVPPRRPMIRQHSSVPAPRVAFARRLRTEARYKHQRSVRMLRVPEPVNW